MTHYNYSKSWRRIELLSLTIFALLTLAKLYQGWSASSLMLVCSLLAGILVADFTSGIVHWFADTWGTDQWPLVGPTLIRSFREHHRDPASITRHDFVETNGASAFAALPLMILCLILPSGWSVFFFTYAHGILWTNQIHKWSHSARIPGWVTWLQKSRLILTVKSHNTHHSGIFDSHYFITTGFWNPILQRPFFGWLERLITRLTGLIPREDDQRSVQAFQHAKASARSRTRETPPQQQISV